MFPPMFTTVSSRIRKSFLSARSGSLGLALAFAALLPMAASAAGDAYSPSGGAGGGYTTSQADDAYRPDEVSPPPETYEPVRPLDGTRRDSYGGGYNGGRNGAPVESGGPGEPYADPPARSEHYEPVPPPEQGGPSESGRYYSQNEIIRTGHGFFGSVSKGLGEAVEWAFQKAGRPNGYILGEDAGGAIAVGLRYGEGTLYTKDAGTHKVYWQGPSIGYDLGAEGSKVMVLVYNLRDPSEIYSRFGGIEGAAYMVGGVGVQLQKSGDVTLAPIRSGIGVRLGANVGYLKYTRNPTWNPF